jgi:uncharacterized coiled-coil DUF342 family protein
VPPVLAQLLLPYTLAQRALVDLRRIADSTVRIADEVTGLHAVLKPMSADLDGLREAFEGSNEQLAALREAMTPELRGIREAAEPLHGELSRQRESIDRLPQAIAPLEKELGDVRDVVEPLTPAAERVGRLAERLPGPGRKR